MARRILPNRGRSDFSGKPRQEFQQKLACYGTLKHFIQLCTMGLFPKNSAVLVGITENVKFNDDLAHFFVGFRANLNNVQY